MKATGPVAVVRTPDTTVVRDRILMAEPRQFRLSGEINAWMHLGNQPDAPLALQQWRGLHATLVRAGFTIEQDRQPKAWPDYVFAANAGLAVVHRGLKTFLPSRFLHPERQGEQALWERWFAARGYRLVRLFGRGEFWEGEGDALFHRGTLFGGWGWRSQQTAQAKVASFLGVPLIAMRLVTPHHYHLDTALAFLDDRTGLWYPPAFDAESREALERHFAAIPGGRLLEVSSEDAARFACNAVPLGRTVVMNSVSDRLVERLDGEGFDVLRTPLSEFLKSGGAAKCLVLWTPAASHASCVSSV